MSTTRICDAGGEGLFLSSSETPEKPDVVGGIIFGVIMVYFFLGVSIIADIFMNSIEAVTAWKRRVMDKERGKKVTVNLWNDTVATLTLMALGSSAPEIFLAVIETFKRNFHSGDLGPSTIVGSASFNLFSIIAVCIVVIPKKEIRWIENMNAFLVTAVFSVGAYMWMVFVLVIHGKDVVDPMEATITFLWLPILVWVSYSVDVGYLSTVIMRFRGETEEPPREEEYSHFMCFERDEISVIGGTSSREISVNVLRKGGLRNHVYCTYRTERLTAVPGYDFVECAGTVDFPTGSTSQSFKIEVLPKRASAVAREFLVVLESADTTCDFHPDSDGPEEQAILTVRVEASSSQVSLARSVDAITNANHFYYALDDWKDQFVGACYCNGSAEEQAEADVQDWVFHVISLPWKLLFSFVPSTGFFGGWLSFIVAISLIGLLTAALSDLAEMFGCLLDVPDIVTATTFVALGTSMPDLFASLSAAVQEPTADASIVNVTGSNSVNVFLGLGLPWSIAAFYWSSAERDLDWELRYPEVAKNSKYDGSAVFVVESRNLGFCVMIFSGLSTIAILLLVMRRKYLGAELGGPSVPKTASAFLLIWLWLSFVALTSWRVLRCEGAKSGDWCKASVKEQAIVCGGVFLSVCIVSIPTLISTRYYSEQAKAEALALKPKRRSSSLEGADNELKKQLGHDFRERSLSKITEETTATNLTVAKCAQSDVTSIPDVTVMSEVPEADDFEPTVEQLPEPHQVFFMRLGEGVGCTSERTFGSKVVSILPTPRMSHSAGPARNRKNLLVNVIVVAYHSTGRNETVFDIKISVPMLNVMQAWCERHGLAVEKALFKLGDRKILPDDTTTSLGHDPTKGPMVLRAFPLRDGDSDGEKKAKKNGHDDSNTNGARNDDSRDYTNGARTPTANGARTPPLPDD